MDDGSTLRQAQTEAAALREENHRLRAALLTTAAERQRVEARLQETDRRLSAYAYLVQQAPSAIVVVDRAHCLVLANATFAHLHGVAVDAIVGKPLMDIIGREHYTLAAPQLNRVFAGHLVEFSTWYAYPDGDRFMHVYYYPIPIEEEIPLVGVILTDITDRERAEEALRDSEERFWAFSEASTEGILLHEEGRIIECNQAIAEHLGYALEELIGMAIVDITAPESREGIIRHIHAGDPGPYEAVSLHKDGSKTIGEIRGRNITYHGRPTRVVAVRDITLLKQAQEQQRVIMHMVSHDLRNPLSIIHGHIQLLHHMLEERDLDGGLQSSTDAIDRATRRMNVMIEDLVDAARTEGKQLVLNCQPVALEAYLRNLLERSRTSTEVERIHLDIPPDLPTVSADYDRLERIFANLLSNALKYSDPDTPVWVRAYGTDHEVVVAISDQGQGISPEEIPHLFERFYRGLRERKTEGIGLGLSISRLL
ncbi:MAG TPA: PAS domain S-box protein, partial [Armatimonadota bacterium]